MSNLFERLTPWQQLLIRKLLAWWLDMPALARNNWPLLSIAVLGATVAITTVVLREDDTSLAFSVEDAALNLDIGGVDTGAVDAENLGTDEVETGLTITETGADTGVFTGTVVITTGSCPGTDDDGTMCVSEGDTVEVCYLPPGDEPVEQCQSIVVQPPASDIGVVTMPATVNAGDDNLVMQIEDADLNTNPGSAQTATLVVTSSRTAESETMTLTETGNDTGIFQTTLDTTDAAGPGTDDDGDFSVQGGDTLTGTYTDAAPSAARTDTTLVVSPPVDVNAGPNWTTWPAGSMVGCDGTPDVYYGCTEPASGAVTDCDDVSGTIGIPDAVEGTGKPHYWYDPLGAAADTDPNGTTLGDGLDAAVGECNGDCTVAIIGKGASTPYVMTGWVS